MEKVFHSIIQTQTEPAAAEKVLQSKQLESRKVEKLESSVGEEIFNLQH